jgi:dCTP deaminase
MLLSDGDIRRLCQRDNAASPLIAPFSEGRQGGGVISYGLTHAGYDLRLGRRLLIFKNTYSEVVNPKKARDTEDMLRLLFDEVTPRVINGFANAYLLPPAPSYALACSLEYLRIPRNLKARCVGKSTYARCGLVVNTTPAEPAWEGHLTIEIANTSPCPVMIFAEEGIAQMEFETLSSLPEIDYGAKGGKYQGQKDEPVPARVKE